MRVTDFAAAPPDLVGMAQHVQRFWNGPLRHPFRALTSLAVGSSSPSYTQAYWQPAASVAGKHAVGGCNLEAGIWPRRWNTATVLGIRAVAETVGSATEPRTPDGARPAVAYLDPATGKTQVGSLPEGVAFGTYEEENATFSTVAMREGKKSLRGSVGTSDQTGAYTINPTLAVIATGVPVATIHRTFPGTPLL